MLSVSYKNSSTQIRKDLGEMIEFMKEIDQLFNGYVDTQLYQLLNEGSLPTSNSVEAAASSSYLA